MAASAASADIFGPQVLIDYQRAQTAAAASFYNSACIEERSLTQPTNRLGTMTRWSAGSQTLHFLMVQAAQKLFDTSMFSAFFGPQVNEIKNRKVNEEVLAELMAGGKLRFLGMPEPKTAIILKRGEPKSKISRFAISRISISMQSLEFCKIACHGDQHRYRNRIPQSIICIIESSIH